MGLRLQNVSLIRNPGTPWEVRALHGIELTIEAGEAIGLMGPSGAGKSSLMQVLSGLVKPTAGTVINSMGKSVGLVFQEPSRGFFAATVWDEVAFGPRNLGLDADERATEALDAVELPRKYWKESPFHLSGGEQRRVAIAAALSMEPKILLLDEPSIGLDWQGESALTNLLQELHHKRHITLMVGSHDPNLLFRLCPRIVVMDGGRIVEDGLWKDWTVLEKAFQSLSLFGPTALEVWTELVRRGAPFHETPGDEESALKLFRRYGEGIA